MKKHSPSKTEIISLLNKHIYSGKLLSNSHRGDIVEMIVLSAVRPRLENGQPGHLREKASNFLIICKSHPRQKMEAIKEHGVLIWHNMTIQAGSYGRKPY